MKYEAGFLVRSSAERFKNAIAVEDETSQLSFNELNATANALGSGLESHGISRGDRVGVLSFNRIEVVQTWCALDKFAMVRVAMHTHTSLDDHRTLLKQVGAKALIFDTRFNTDVNQLRESLSSVSLFVGIGNDCPEWAVSFDDVVAEGSREDRFIEVDEDDPCSLQLTSGTTGVPKPWLKSYRSWQATITHNLIHLDTFDDQPAVDSSDVNLHFHPLQWATGFQTLYPYLLRGARTLITPDEPFDPAKIVDLLERKKVTGTFAPGPLLVALLDEIESRAGIDHAMRRLVILFGSAELLDRATNLLGPVWAHGFGSTEQGAVTTRLLPSDVREKRERIASVGRAGSPNFEVAVAAPDGTRVPRSETGEILVRSAMSQGEYWGMEEATENAFYPGDWFRSGDVGFIDDDGFLYYTDRAGDTIFRADQAIYPHAIEEVVLADKAVANCGVVGLDVGGETNVVAAVLLRPNHPADEPTRARIQSWLDQNVEGSILPVEVKFVDEIPTVLGGAKVQRGALRKQLEESR